MSFSIRLGDFLYKNAFVLYAPLYKLFKYRQDAFEINLIRKYLPVNGVALDIGANIGFYAAILSKIVGPSGKVHCFEPDLTNFRHLQNAMKPDRNVIINNTAVGAVTEKLKMYTSKNLNVDHRTYEPEEYDQVHEIEAISIDDYLKPGSMVDLIKMDIQGFEMQAIKGMKRTLLENPDVTLLSEFWPYGLKKSGSSVVAYFDFLLEHHFKVYLLEKNSLHKLGIDRVMQLQQLGEKHYFNILATRKNAAEV
jgi:FkbM family methyltransferase